MRFPVTFPITSLVLVASAATACQKSTAAEPETVKRGANVEVRIAGELARVRQARIFFSHHSVGGNLLEGAESLYTDDGGGPLKLVPFEKAAADSGPGWLDASGGQNGDPKSKIDFFAATIRKDAALKPKLAFMKFCYVDFNPHTNVDDLFAYYQRTLTSLKREHPEITFAHVTAPLMRRPMELKWRVRRALGRMVWEDEANVKRYQFNQRLLKEFSGDPIFDLARAESTTPDGARVTFEHQGGVYYSLNPGYTEDGGHLNQLGQRVIAAEMIRFAARALATSD